MKFFAFTLLPRLLENNLRKWRKRVSGCSSVAVKTIWKLSRTLGLTYPSLLEVKAFTPPYMPPIYTRVDYCDTCNGSKSKWYMVCVFIFYVKIFMQCTFIYTINLLKPYLFQSSNDSRCSVGLRHPTKKYSNLRKFWIISINLCHF